MINPQFIAGNAQRRHKNQSMLEFSTAVSLIRYEDETPLLGVVKGQNLTIAEIKLVIKTLADIIRTLHKMSLYHGDLTSESVFVAKRNEVYMKYYIIRLLINICINCAHSLLKFLLHDIRSELSG